MLIDKVKETDSNMGIIFDGDGDRIGVIDEKEASFVAIYSCVL